jgi:hypothetical protein
MMIGMLVMGSTISPLIVISICMKPPIAKLTDPRILSRVAAVNRE